MPAYDRRIDLRHWIVGELVLIADRVTTPVLALVPVDRRSGLAEAEDHHLTARLV